MVPCVPVRGTIDKAFDRHRRHARSRLQPEVLLCEVDREGPALRELTQPGSPHPTT